MGPLEEAFLKIIIIISTVFLNRDTVGRSISENNNHYNNRFLNKGTVGRSISGNNNYYNNRFSNRASLRSRSVGTKKGEGEKCFKDEECQLGICTYFKCRPKLEDGERCYKDDNCKLNSCAYFVCRPKLDDGEDCYTDTDCTSQSCNGHPKQCQSEALPATPAPIPVEPTAYPTASAPTAYPTGALPTTPAPIPVAVESSPLSRRASYTSLKRNAQRFTAGW